ncbi:hypothetical protein ACQP2P_10645 [Dactylosporangium sp. CA-139114]|uniref:hypothetical protein n=1 Tax=Dactylosporangium sp. CA-139114 TaxID=3239931 RepID=UPI003D968E1E
MRVDVGAALDAVPPDDLEARVLALVDAMFAGMETVPPRGRPLIRPSTRRRPARSPARRMQFVDV